MPIIPVKIDKLLIVWINGDKEVPETMLFPFLSNRDTLDEWDKIRRLVWGPSVKIFAGSFDQIQEIKKNLGEKLEIIVCSDCADKYKVKAKISKYKLDLVDVTQTMNNMLAGSWRVLSI